MTTTPTDSQAPAAPWWRSTLNVVNLAASVLTLGLAAAALVGAVIFSAGERTVGILLCVAAGLGVMAVLATERKRSKLLQVVATVLALTVATAGAILVYRNPPPATVEITDPVPGTPKSTCDIEIRFKGEPPRGQVFVVATRQGGSSYYFETAIERDPSVGPQVWRAQLQVGANTKGLGERYDIFVFAMDRNLAGYLSTVRKDLNPTNTFWASESLPPGVDRPADTTYVTRTLAKDPTCPE